MLQDEGCELLRRAAKHLHKSWKATGDEGDYIATNLLRWMFTVEAFEPEVGDAEVRTVQIGVLNNLPITCDPDMGRL